MTQFPNNRATRLTESIMAAIDEHLKQEPPPQEQQNRLAIGLTQRETHHYNRAYEKIHQILSKELGT